MNAYWKRHNEELEKKFYASMYNEPLRFLEDNDIPIHKKLRKAVKSWRATRNNINSLRKKQTRRLHQSENSQTPILTVI